MKNVSTFKRIILFAILSVFGYYVALPSAKSSDYGLASKKITVIDKHGTRKTNAPELTVLMREMDRVEKSSKPISDEDRKRITDKIKTEIAPIIEPNVGEYPVKFFNTSYELPLMDKNYGIEPAWIDNRYVIYWGWRGSAANVPIERSELIIFDTDTGKLVSTLIKNIYSGDVCFDPKTRNVYFSAPQTSGIFVQYGKIDKDLKLINLMDNNKNPNIYLVKSNCAFTTNNKFRMQPTRPEDGTVKQNIDSKGQLKAGKFLITREDGSIKTININSPFSGVMKHDRVRDQYYIAFHISLTDQRIRVYYYDRDFNLVDEYLLPRLFRHTSMIPTLSFPVKGGFVIPCSTGYTTSKKALSRAGNGLCYARYDGSVTRILSGAVSENIAISESGCKIFGSHKVYTDSVGDEEKHFVLNICN